jgi:hypothetical protein
MHAEQLVGQTLTTNTEVAVVNIIGASQAGIPEPGIVPPPIPTLIRGILSVSLGAAATQLEIRCRTGIIAPGTNNPVGTIIDLALFYSVTANGFAVCSFEFYDVNGQGSANGYTITAQQATATGNGSAVGHVNMEPQ